MTEAKHILIVDDEPDIRQILQDILQDEGYQTSLAADADEARNRFKENIPDLVLLDIWMPKEDGISLLKDWVQREILESTPVIMISGHGTVENAVEAVKLGAYDFMEKPLSTGKLLLCVERALETSSLRAENKQLKTQLSNTKQLVTISPASQELERHIRLLGPTDSWVFITGESGSGKKLVAQQIHQQSPRQHGDFVELNLAAIPEDHVAEQLFGIEQNGRSLAGSFEKAKGGTLFINEVLGLSLETQQKLSSALQEKRFVRVGGNENIDLDVRVIVATSGNPQQAVSEGLFLEDLFYRLNVIPIDVPPLSQRQEDLPELIELFINDISNNAQIKSPVVSNEAMKLLCDYQWPGNVRQLQNILQRIVILGDGKEITAHSVSSALGKDAELHKKQDQLTEFFSGTMREAKEQFERAYLQYHLDHVHGNVSKLAKLVDLERTHLYRKLKSLDINTKESRH